MIELEDVNKNYQLGNTSVAALKSINLSIDKGEFLAIWGPSGSGKTSLLNVIGLIDAPSSGRYKLDGTSINGLNDERVTTLRSNQVGFVFQHFNLIPVLTAVENVALVLEISGMNTKQAKQKAFECLQRVGLAEFAEHRPDKMSGGQRQRVAIARALVGEPLLVVADEPTANLDSETGQSIIDLMRELNVQDQITFVFSTHDPQLLENVHRRVRVKDGLIVDDVTGAK